MKKAFFLLIVLAILFPSSALAYEGGALDGKEMKYGRPPFDTRTPSFNQTNNATDNDLKTIVRLSSGGFSTPYMWYDFPSPVYLNSYIYSGKNNTPQRLEIGVLYEGDDKPTSLITSADRTYTKQPLPATKKVKSIYLRNLSSWAEEVEEFDVFSPSPDEIPLDDVKNFRIKSMDNEGTIYLAWDFYESPIVNFKEFRLYKNGLKVGSSIGNSSSVSTKSTFVNGDTFTLKVVNKKGIESGGVSVEARYDPPLGNIEDLKAKPDYNRVNLSWILPESDKFKHVNIYRETVPEEKGLFQRMFSAVSVSAADGPTKIFETNGTYFNDLTVKPETTYEYKLTSVGTDGKETNGATVQATTLEEPTPVIKNPGYEITPEGDYLYTWTSPDKGKVKVLISGNEYQTVDAADKKILIPKDKMKYKMMGEPDISLQPISEYGKEGEIHKESPFDEGILPFKGGDLLKTSMSLMVVLGPFILLALAFLIYPKLKQLIVKALEKRNGRRKM